MVGLSLVLTSAFAATGCQGGGGPDPFAGQSLGVAHPHTTDVLMFEGTATATDDPEALAAILDAHGLSYRIVSENELNQMSEQDIASYGMILWPGGYASQMSAALTQEARDNIHNAVAKDGVSFMGICAGAFIAATPDTTWGFSIPTQDVLPYYHLTDDGVEDAMVDVTFAGNTHRQLVWWGGPKFPEVPGGVIARYSDDHTPAIIETMAGNGFVLLTGPHTEAPDSWRAKLGLNDTDGGDQDTAWQLINAALNRSPLATVS